MGTSFNPVSTSGISFKLEHYVQASFLASLLLETPIPFGNGLTIKELNFQAKLTANADDIIVHFSNLTKFLVQSKKGFEINSNKTFYEVIDYLWKDFNKGEFDKSYHKFIITTDILSKADVDHGLLVLEWARFSKDFDEFYTKLKANKEKLSKYKYFIQAIGKANGAPADNDLVFDFLKTIFIKTYDYLESGSKDKEVLKWYLQPFLSTGQTSENALQSLLTYIEICNQHGATINKSNADEKIKQLFDLSKSTIIGSELTEFIKKSNSQLHYTIHNEIGGFHIDRSEQLAKIQQLLIKNRIVIISGEGGVGKSGLAKEFFGEIYKSEEGYLVFKADQLDRSSLAHALSDIGILSDFETLLSQWRLLPKLIIYIDSFEKLYESENKEAFFEFLGKLRQVNNVKLVATCRSYAIETLRTKYKISKDEIGIVELLPLTEGQLNEIAKHKEKLRNLISNPRLKRLVCLPFYLDTALQVIDSLDDKEELNEYEFKEALWKLIIEKKGSDKSGTSKKRADVFSAIVLKRAKEKMPYIKADAQADINIVAELEKDGLLIKHTKFDAYTPAHDIFEDMVVIKHLNESFQVKENSSQFIHSIDANPVFRRGTRLWIQELIFGQPKEAKIFLSEIFPLYGDSPIIDEILIGILGSDQAYLLIIQNVDLFLKDNLKLFFKSFHLLKIAYTEPYQGEHPERKLKSISHGWTALLKIMDEHLAVNPNAFSVVRLDLLSHWTFQFDQDDFIPPEGEIVSRHCLQLLELDKEAFRFDLKRRILEILFSVAFYAKEEIEKIIINAIEAKKANSSNTHYRISFYRDLFKMLLIDTFRCINIYKLFPELIIQLAELEWYSNKVAGDYDSDYTESSFGFVEYPYKYFNASAFQTPFIYLFRYHSSLALDFLIEVCNRSIQFYLKSVYAEQSQTRTISIKLSENKEVFLYGDSTLWSVYRGLGHSPDLLQSALMAFEKYLFNATATDNLPSDLFENVIEKSNSVLMPAALTSLAMAYPLVFKDKILILLERREIFAWDLSRYSSEMMNSIHTAIGNDLYYTRERQLANELKHRKKNLESLVSTLQFYYPQKICDLIDNYKANVHPEDYLWQLALTRMDVRNTTPEVREEENVVLFNPNPLPEKLQEFIDEGETERENDSSAISVFLWADNVFSGKEEVSLTYEMWEENYRKLSRLSLDGSNSLFDSSKKIAAIGVKYFSGQLTKEEKEYCAQKIINDIQQVLAKLKLGYSHSVLDVINDTTFSILPILFKPEFKDFVNEDSLKEAITDLLILLPYDGKKHLVNGIREYFWPFKKDVANYFFQILLKSATEPHLGYKIQKMRDLSDTSTTKKVNGFLRAIKELPDIEAKQVDLVTTDKNKILYALQSVPFSLLNKEYREYINHILQHLSTMDDSEDINNREFIEGLQILLGNYFINNDDENSTSTLLNLLGLRITQFKFMMDTLKRLVWLGHDAQYPEQFWFHLNVTMQHVLHESPTVGLVHIILLEPLKNIDRCYKVPGQGLGHALHELIISEFASDKNLIEAVFKLLAGAGSIYQPVCLTWLMKSLPDKKSYEESFGIFFNSVYMNQFVQQLYNQHLDHMQKNMEQLNYFITLLNLLIDKGSTEAFRIRDELI
jgi:hypothetical protein